MLENTFIHIQGIGPKTEQNLWRKGIYTWEHFLTHGQMIFSRARDSFVRKELEESLNHLNDICFFKNRLSSADIWRLYGAFKSGAVYLDIETSGGYPGIDEITVIGIYDGNRVQTFVNGINKKKTRRPGIDPAGLDRFVEI